MIVLPCNSETYVEQRRFTRISGKVLSDHFHSRSRRPREQENQINTHIILKSDPPGVDDLILPSVDMGDLVPHTSLLDQFASSFDLYGRRLWVERIEVGRGCWVRMVKCESTRRGITDLEVQAWLVMFVDLGSIWVKV